MGLLSISKKFAIISAVISIIILIMLHKMAQRSIYNDLPEQIAADWNSAGMADYFMPNALVAFSLAVLFMAINIYSKTRLFNDSKRVSDDHAMEAGFLYGIQCG